MPNAESSTSEKPIVKFETVPMGTSAQRVRELVNRDGAVVIEDCFRADQVVRLNAEIDPYLAKQAPGNEGGSEFFASVTGLKTKRITNLVTRSTTFRNEILDSDQILGYVDVMLLPHSDAYWLSTAQVIQIEPGEKPQYLHRDLENFPIFRQMGPSAPESAVNFIVALSEFTEEMGATRVIPGSQQWPDFNHRGSQEQTIGVEMKKGSALYFSGKVLHGGGANVTNRPRRAVAMYYHLGYLTPEEAYPFTVPLELARTLSPRAQQLIGFRSFHNAGQKAGSLWQIDYVELAKYLKLEA